MKKTKVWGVDDVKSLIGQLAHSQGFYGRLYAQLEETDAWDRLVDAANENGCADDVDLILLIEQ